MSEHNPVCDGLSPGVMASGPRIPRPPMRTLEPGRWVDICDGCGVDIFVYGTKQPPVKFRYCRKCSIGGHTDVQETEFRQAEREASDK